MNFKKLIAKKLRDLLVKKGITQKELANGVGISKTLLNQYFLGNYLIGLDNLYKISQYLDTDITYFLTDSQPSIESLDEQLFNQVFTLGLEYANQHNLKLSGSYFIAIYDFVKNDDSKKTIEEKFIGIQPLIKRLYNLRYS